MPRTTRPPRLPAVLLEALFPSPQLLTGRLAASTVAMYTRDCAAYVAFCGYDGVVAVQAETLRRWRTYLVEDTRLSPHTINRMLAAVKRVLKEAAVQGIVERAEAGACAEVEGVSVAALRHRLKTTARVRLTPAQMRQLCEAPALSTLLGLRDRALLATLAGSGCRISEVVTLTVGQLSARDGGYVLQVLGKGQAAPREAPLSREAYAHLQTWLAQRAAQGGGATPVIFAAFAGPRPTARRLTAGAAWSTSSPTTFGVSSARSSPSAISARPRRPWGTSAWRPPPSTMCSMSSKWGSPMGSINGPVGWEV